MYSTTGRRIATKTDDDGSIQPYGCNENTPPNNGASNTSAGHQSNLITMMTPIQTKQLSADGFQWHLYSPRVATITNELIHFACVAYFAFDGWDEAHNFFKSITDKRVCSRAQVRQAERFNSSHEVKVWGLNQSTLEKLIERDRSRLPKSLPLPPVRHDWSLSESYDFSYKAAV